MTHQISKVSNKHRVSQGLRTGYELAVLFQDLLGADNTVEAVTFRACTI